MASVRFQLENLGEDKHVEGILVHCLDEGSTPSISTIYLITRPTLWIWLFFLRFW